MRRNLKQETAALRFAWAGACLLGLLAIVPVVGSVSTAAATARTVFGIPLAVADFDGDRRPDLATVSIDRSNSSGTDYCIQFRFSGMASTSIGLSARGGGLNLVPEDVNGDALTDLIVSSALDSKVVAVLLNDGHGNFTVASPGQFPFPQAETDALRSKTGDAHVDPAATEGLRYSFGGEVAPAADRDLPVASDVALSADRTAARREGLRVCAGRAPPLLRA